MAGYTEYIKGGYILIAPSLDYEDHYILKCSECEEYHSLLESFLSHCITHYALEPKKEQPSPPGPLAEMCNDDDNGAVITYNFSVASGFEDDTDADENIDSDENVDPLNSFKHEAGVETSILMKEESAIQEESNVNNANMKNTTDPQLDHISENIESDNEDPLNSYNHEADVETETLMNEEIAIQEESNMKCANMEITTDPQLYRISESIESDNESLDGPDNQARIYIRNFLKSEKNVTALISAYKNIPHMWNLNYPTNLRRKVERIKSLQQIAAELENINLQISSEQVSAIIVNLRLKYRERLKRDTDLNIEPGTSQKDDILPQWIFQRLAFLKPFVEYNPIAILDSRQQDLAPEQIIQILEIYKRCPYLWDTNLMEHYCYNKRSEALLQMIQLIDLEMGIDVDESDLKKYLRCLHVYFARGKRNEMGIIKVKEGRSDYFEHMAFLDDHVGPFICTECNKKFKSPIYLKEHMSQHDGKIPLHCSLCKHEFKTATAYMAHVRRHMGDLGEECKECGKKFLKPVELRIHMRSHTGDKPFCCELCGTSFRQQQAFLAHKRKHENKFVQFCPICSKGFYTKTKMNIHIAIHYDVRNFVCGICGKAFKTKKTLQNHEFTHEEGRNHECDLCGKLFKNKINLAHHKRTHGSNIKDMNTK